MPAAYPSDPALVRRAEERARELLRSTAGDEALEMYERLGFLSIEHDGGEYGYLIYPQRPIVGYDARSGELLSEYCVRFREGPDPETAERLPDADDVLAKWMALNGAERELIAESNHDPAGHQVDPAHVRRDIARIEALAPATSP